MITPSLSRAGCQKLHTKSRGISEQCLLLVVIFKCKVIVDTVIICEFFWMCFLLIYTTKEVTTKVCDLITSTSFCFYLEVSKKASHTCKDFF